MGDVFKYVEQSENIDFREAVELLADKYHIELHYENSGNGPARENTGSKRTRLLEACEEAQRFFVSQILTKEALPARKLLGGRNFSQADCERFGCGYAPQGWDNLVRHLASKGFTQKEILDAGLARQGQRGIYDYFRGRVTWPSAIRPAARSASARANYTKTIRSPPNTSTRRTRSSTAKPRCFTASIWPNPPSSRSGRW